MTNNILFSIFKQRSYVYIWSPGWRHEFSCSFLSGPPADGTILHVVFYPDRRLTAHIYKKFSSGSPPDGSQRVKRHCSGYNYRSRSSLNNLFLFIRHSMDLLLSTWTGWTLICFKRPELIKLSAWHCHGGSYSWGLQIQTENIYIYLDFLSLTK